MSLAVASVVWAGCSDGGGGYSGNAATGGDPPAPAQPAPTPPATGGSVPRVFAVLAWAPASGPVDQYRVYVEWDGSGSFVPYSDVLYPGVSIEGDIGQTLRMQVSALDAQGNEGPRSPPSKTILLTDRMPPANASSAAQLASADADDDASADRARRVVSDDDAPSDPSDPGDPGDDAAAATGVAGDLSGDGRADLLWESQDGLRLRITDVDLAVWLEMGRPASEWSLVGLGDLDADGRVDVWWQSAAGDVAVTRGALLAGQPALTPLEVLARLDPGETLERVADYDGDGLADALVDDAAGGTLWLTRDGVFQLVPLSPPEPDARLASVSGDLDGDGSADLVWTLASGDLWVQFLAGGRPDGDEVLAGAGTPVAGLDTDADGEDELVLRLAAGLATLGLDGGLESWSVTLSDPDTLVGCADYDGDGDGDLLWHSDGELRFVTLPGERTVPEMPGWTPLSLCR